MKLTIFMLGFTISSLSLAQAVPYKTTTTTTTTTAPTPTKVASDDKENNDCPPPSPKKKPVCPKPKPKPRPRPAPVPTTVKCPEVKPCKACEPKIVEKTVEKVKYVDRTVTVDNTNKHTINALAGVGPEGIVVDSYQTEDRKDEYGVRKERDKPKGAVVGLQYQYHFTPAWNVGVMGLSNQTYLGNIGFSW
jgi:hypothetical protein